MMKTIRVKTPSREVMVNIDAEVQKAVRDSGVKEGLCYVYVPHTTAAVTINENADPDVRKDIVSTLAQVVPRDANYAHREGNADAHVKASMVGSSEVIFVEDGRLILGTWQSVFFCEFDGPRNRTVMVKATQTV